jgi:acetolactate synthase-1/2/3 large subunit
LGCGYAALGTDAELSEGLRAALALADGGKPVIVEVRLDVEAPTYFTRGVIAANFGRLGLWDKSRLAARLAARNLGAGRI